MNDLFSSAGVREDQRAPDHVVEKERGAAVATSAQTFEMGVCCVCGAPGGFGFGVSLRKGLKGRWSCFEHRAQVAHMVTPS